MKIERAEVNQASFDELCALLLPMAREVGLAPFDYRTARENGYRTLSEGMTFVARHQTGAIMGTVGMVRSPLWYARWPDYYTLTDSWFYVAPEFRGGRAAAGLIHTVRDLGRSMAVPTFIRVVNPNRRERLIRLV